MQGMAAAGLTGMAGCLGGDGDGGDDGNATGPGPGPGEDRTQVDLPADRPDPGGEFIFAVGRGSIGNYDTAESTLADDSMVLATISDGLRVQTTGGKFYNWMAEEYGVESANDVSMPGDYTDYMAEYEIANVSEGVPTFDLGDNNLVFPTSRTSIGIAAHPDDIEALENGELEAGDQMRVLTRTEAADAVDDGTFGVKVTGKLREGIQFHDGTELTAGDLVGSYDRLVGSTNQGQQFSSFLDARAPDGADGYTFEMYGQEADAIAASALVPFDIWPESQHDIEAGGLDPRTEGGETPIGTGPYEIADFEEGQFLELSRTDNYWVDDFGVENFEWIGETLPDDVDPEAFPNGPLPETIRIRFQPESGQRVAALQEEEIDVAYELSPGEYTNFDELEGYRVGTARSTGFLFMQFALADEGDLAAQEVRQAVQMMIPRQQITDVVAEGWASPARLPFPRPAAGLASESDYEELFDADWSYAVEPQPDEAESLLNDAGVSTPVEFNIDTNADDDTRINKMELVVASMNESGLFDASLDTPADINTWFVQDLAVDGSNETYASENRVAVIGLAAGFDPHGYAQALHSPDNYNGCCNFFHPPGTFDWIDTLAQARFSVDAAESVQFRQQTYDEIWPQIAEDVGNTIIDYSLEVVIAGPKLEGYDAYPDRRGFLTWSLWAPYENQVTLLPPQQQS